ncbi:unnamed protein product [Trifolium pratense]|uniref:Uncharacterized protein n=1 Tax=Trifolium pratense TaxID=57577 RepID=A0ACB0JWA2_TRIPR|nr:unnamed protein product [Trifolium pratense]
MIQGDEDENLNFDDSLYISSLKTCGSAGYDVAASFVWRDQHVAAVAFPAQGGRAASIETGTKLYISNLDYGVSNDDIKDKPEVQREHKYEVLILLGDASSALGRMSKGVAALSMDKFIHSRQRQVENKGVEDFGDVVRE